MTIYVTPFRRDTKQATADSADSGFSSIDEAVAAMGQAPVSHSSAMAVFHTGDNDGLFYSRYRVRGCADVRG